VEHYITQVPIDLTFYFYLFIYFFFCQALVISTVKVLGLCVSSWDFLGDFIYIYIKETCMFNQNIFSRLLQLFQTIFQTTWT